MRDVSKTENKWNKNRFIWASEVLGFVNFKNQRVLSPYTNLELLLVHLRYFSEWCLPFSSTAKYRHWNCKTGSWTNLADNKRFVRFGDFASLQLSQQIGQRFQFWVWEQFVSIVEELVEHFEPGQVAVTTRGSFNMCIKE